MRMSEILQTFHCMPSCDRMDLVCRMLQHCLPCELRFLGTLICDCARKDHDTLGRAELNANRVNYFSGFKDTGLTHEVCEKLCCALAVVHADNHPVAETVFSLLNDKRVLNFFEETTDLKVLEDFRLLYVMAVNHPALSFNQKLHLMYSFLHRMDAIFIEKCKCNFSSSFSSNSAERSGEGELGRYVTEGSIREPGSNAFIVRCEVHSVYKRPSDRRYVYMVEVEWSDGTSYTVRRTYGDFFSFQNKLLDLFPEEAGQKHKKQRVIPFLPGKKLLSSLSNRELAEKRLPELAKYARELVSLPEHVSRSGYVMEFFKPRPVDNKEEYPPLHKIITLCDLLESGKARHPSAPAVLLKSSPVHSPTPIRKSPFQRLVAFGSAPSPSSSPAQQQRNSHTLPHSIHTSVQQPDESSLERRFTYPSRKSAFTPVAPPSSSQNVPTTASSLTSIASSATPTSVSASPAFPTATTTSNSTPYITTSSSLTSLPSSDSIVMVTNHVGSSSPHSSTASHSCTDSSALITATVVANPQPNAQTLVTSSSPSLVHNKSSPAPSVAPQLQTVQVTGTSIVTKLPLMQMSPTTYATSPLIASNVTQVQARTSITTPSPPHSGTSTPKGFSPSLIPFGNLGIPQQFIGSASPVAPFGPYILTGSPLHSPLPSPKTPKHIHGSHNSVARTPTEYDSLAKWLKAHRLHKYSSLFENVTFEELSYLSEEQLKEKGMTQGAAKKLHLKIEELKRLNFTGFRDMPFGAGMSRKPSTCSLPAALLLERGMTPSSSFEGLSPTDSTCSLDKFNSMHSHRRNTSYVAATDVPKGQRASAEAPVITSVDAAILKVVPSNQGCDDSVVFSESPIRTQQKGSPPASAPATPKVQNRHLESSDSLRTSTSVKRDSSWADQVVPNEDMGLNRPEWAQMSLNGEVKPRQGEIHQGTPTHTLPGHSSPFHQLLTTHPLPTSQGMPVPVRRPIAKRHSGETYSASLIQVPGTPEGKTRENGFSDNSPHIPQPLMPTGVISHRHIIPLTTTNTAMAAAVARHHHHPSSNSLPLIRANRPQQSTYTAYAVNGLIPTPPLSHRTQHHMGGVVSYPGGQIRGQHNMTCFNCGKRGHLGYGCPGETMETNNPAAFHKQLEKLAKRKSPGQSQGAVQ